MDDDHRIFLAGCNIQSETSVRHTASGIAWRFAPTSTDMVTSTWPAELPIAHIYCEANKQVTVKAWLRRSNTDLSIGIIAKKKQLTGMTNDVSTFMTAAADTWEEVTITFTPTEEGVVEILAQAYGGTTPFGYTDDVPITRQDGISQTITLNQAWFGEPFEDIASGGGVLIKRKYVR